MSFLISLFSLKFVKYNVYMLQQVEYQPALYIQWLLRVGRSGESLSSVQKRKELNYTKRAKMMISAAYIVISVWIVGIIVFSVNTTWWSMLAILAYPLIVMIAFWVTTGLVQRFFLKQELVRHKEMIRQKLENHQGKIVVVAGSFGKTTFKEFLAQLLEGELNFAFSPGNRNTFAAHARFTSDLTGNEEVIVFELGEERPGDIEGFLDVIPADIAVVTGFAPNHLDNFPEGEKQLLSEFESVGTMVGRTYYFEQSAFSGISKKTFSNNGVEEWRVSSFKNDIKGLQVGIEAPGGTVFLKTKLLGEHLIAPLVMSAYLAAELGLKTVDIEANSKSIKPFEHRMELKEINGGYLIDDSYNGNIEGLTAGLQLLNSFDAIRKIYITPGLSEQGSQKEAVHRRLAGKIAAHPPDLLVLMNNTATDIVSNELKLLNYTGEIELIDEPLHFYQTMEHRISRGTVMMIQNDWTDNYN